MKNIPEKIYLQLELGNSEIASDDFDFEELDSSTIAWSKDSTDLADIAYVIAPAKLQHQLLSQNSVAVNRYSGGLKKIKAAEKHCPSPEHTPPSNILLEAGTYEYTCPKCGNVITFTVPFITC